MARVIGIPSEVKDSERRVGLQPDGAAELMHQGHEVLVQEGSGVKVASSAGEVFAEPSFIVKAYPLSTASSKRARGSSPTCIWLRTRNSPSFSCSARSTP